MIAGRAPCNGALSAHDTDDRTEPRIFGGDATGGGARPPAKRVVARANLRLARKRYELAEVEKGDSGHAATTNGAKSKHISGTEAAQGDPNDPGGITSDAAVRRRREQPPDTTSSSEAGAVAPPKQGVEESAMENEADSEGESDDQQARDQATAQAEAEEAAALCEEWAAGDGLAQGGYRRSRDAGSRTASSGHRRPIMPRKSVEQVAMSYKHLVLACVSHAFANSATSGACHHVLLPARAPNLRLPQFAPGEGGTEAGVLWSVGEAESIALAEPSPARAAWPEVCPDTVSRGSELGEHRCVRHSVSRGSQFWGFERRCAFKSEPMVGFFVRAVWSTKQVSRFSWCQSVDVLPKPRIWIVCVCVCVQELAGGKDHSIRAMESRGSSALCLPWSRAPGRSPHPERGYSSFH